MKKSKLNIFLTTTLISGSFLAACFLPGLSYNSPSSELNSTDSLTTVNQASPRIAISETEDISSVKITTTNMTWPNDVYSTTNGYKFLSVVGSKNVYTIDANGVKFDTEYPSYSTDEGILIDGSVGINSQFPFEILPTKLMINGPTYDASKNIITDTKQLASVNMTFGNTTADNFRGQANVLLSRNQPYFKIQAPLVTHNLARWYNDGGGIEDRMEQTFFEYKDKEFFKSNKDSKSYDGQSQTAKNAKSGCFDVRGIPINRRSAPSLRFTLDYHTTLFQSTINLGIFNDYNVSGVLQATHLLNTTSGFNSVLPKLTVDDSLLDKTKNVLEQDLTLTNLFKIANGQSIPTMGGYSLTAEKTPTTETILFTYKPKFVFTNGELVEYKGPGASVAVNGFSKLKTFITPLDSYNNNIVVDRFIKYVTKDGVVDSNVLGTFLDLSSVPPDVTYEIKDPVVDLISGLLKFKITSSNCYSEADFLLNRVSPNYNIAIQLAPRITKIAYTKFLDDILVTQYYSQVFNENGLIDLMVFNKYAQIVAPVDNAQYYLVPGSYAIDTGDGTVDFKIYASTYYGSDAQEKAGIENDTTTHFDVNLVLNPLPSKAVVKDNYVPAHRVDKFIDLVANTDGSVKNLDLLKEYVDMENIPTAATYAIDFNSVQYDPFNADFYYEYVNFDLVIDKYNETSFISNVPKTLPLRVKLNPVHLETEVAAKTVTSPERVDRLLPKIINNQGIVTNRSLLEKYVDIKALPQRSVLSISNEVLDNASGKLTFDLKASVAYGNDSNELINQVYPVELQLGIKHRPTTVTPVTNPVNPERVDRFAQVLKSLDSDGLKNYLVPHYLEIDGEFPIAENAVTYAVVNLTYQDEGAVKFDLIINSAYDSDSDPQINHTFPITLNLAKKFTPTKISAYSNYPRGSTISEFKALYAKYKDHQDELKTFLSHFLKGIDTIPDNAITSLNIDANKTDEVTGKLFFNVQTSTYYNESSDLISDAANPYVSNEIQLDLIPSDQQATLTTKIDWKNDVSIGGKAQAFYALVNPNNKVDIEALSDYLELTNIPLDATITLENKDPNFKNALLLDFDIVLTYWWEAGTLKPEAGDVVQVKHFALKNNLYVLNTSTKSLSFEWWWVALGIGGAVLLVTSYFLIKQYNEERKFKQRALGL